MTDFLRLSLAVIIYRLVVVLVGFLFGSLGYCLFRLGIYEKAGELKASWKGASLGLRQAAPGTFFALFGASIVCVALFRGFEIRSNAEPLTNVTQGSAPDLVGGEVDQSKTFLKEAESTLAPLDQKIQKGQAFTKSDYEEVQGLYLSAKAAKLGSYSGFEIQGAPPDITPDDSIPPATKPQKK